MHVETISPSSHATRVAAWRRHAGPDHPAGDIFMSEFAEADIVGGTDIVVTDCIMCTGSVDAHTRHILCGA